MNEVVLTGEVISKPEVDFEAEGEATLYRMYIKNQRKSGVYDIVSVRFNEMALLSGLTLETLQGKFIKVHGNFRSYNKSNEQEKRFIEWDVFAETIENNENPEQETDVIIMEGYVGKKEDIRVTGTGRKLVEIFLSVPRLHDRTDYIPCLIWGQFAHHANRLKIGDKIHLEGRIQSREYNKVLPDGTLRKKMVHEVSCTKFSKITTD